MRVNIHENGGIKMIIKYSNKIKKLVPETVLYECIHISLSVVPYFGAHGFDIEIQNNTLKISHYAKEIKQVQIIEKQSLIKSMEQTRILVYHHENCVFCCCVDELR